MTDSASVSGASPMPGQRVLDDVADRLGTRLEAAEPVGWGDARATSRLFLADGRSVAARRFEGRGSLARVERIARLMGRLAGAGLPVPSPTIVATRAGQWLVTDWVDGRTGATWLDDPDRARHLADRMGRLARQVRAVPVDDRSERDRPTDLHPADAPAGRAFIHGDFAPVNVVMRADGEIGALLDFEHAGTGPALLDVAWWGWVVRHHHPEAWAAAWPTLLEATGLDIGPVETHLHDLVLRTLASRAAAGGDARVRRRWQDRLTEARAWTVPSGQTT